MKVLRITESLVKNAVCVYKCNTKTGTELLLWDFSDGSLEKFLKWYGSLSHVKISYNILEDIAKIFD